jgi:Kef-type K+ transport system membrane component KefB
VAALTDVRLVTDFLVPALVLVVVRAIAFLLAARVAGRLAGNLEIGRLGAASLLPQAGFAALLAATLVEPHEAWRGLLVAVVLVNLVLTPPLLKVALRAAEAAAPTTPAPEGLAS